jgi:hypothetical protein
VSAQALGCAPRARVGTRGSRSPSSRASGRRRTRGIYELADSAPGTTKVSFTNEFEPAGTIERLQAPLARSYLRRQNARALGRLKAILENGA